MLVPAIEFDLSPNDTRYIIPDTEDNWELVARDPRTHNIKFSQMYDFQVNAANRNAPKFIQFGNAFFTSVDNLPDIDIDGVDYGDRII